MHHLPCEFPIQQCPIANGCLPLHGFSKRHSLDSIAGDLHDVMLGNSAAMLSYADIPDVLIASYLRARFSVIVADSTLGTLRGPPKVCVSCPKTL